MLAFMAVAFLTTGVFAASKGIQITTKDSRQVGHYENSYALLIGVSDYTAGWPDLQAVPSELSQVQAMLEKKGFSVTRTIDPQSSQLRNSFESFINDYGYDTHNRLLVYFSGHGYTRDNGSKGYLVPTDAPDPRRDERGFLRKAYAMIDLLALARKVEANHVLFLFDSCFSGTIFKTKALPDTPPLITTLTSKPVRQFITAGDAGETVPAKSVFTPAFIEALEYGTGDLNNDGYVTGSELGMHLQSVVSNSVRQTPQYGKITDFELSRGDFVFLASLTAPTIVVPDKPSQASSVSLDDLTRQAEEAESTEAAWGTQLANMKDVFSQAQVIDNKKVSADIKIAAWQRFQRGFAEDNPYSTHDESMRKTAVTRIQALQKERPRLASASASVAAIATSGQYKDCDYCPEMVLIPAGQFRMGDLKGDGSSDEKPVHQIAIDKPFAMGKYEVTFAEYDAYATAKGRSLPKDQSWGRDRRPAISVSWDDAKAYAKWLSEETGKRFRLPSETEWEYAARAGSASRYSWGDEIGTNRGNCNGCGSEWDDSKTAPVGSFQPNEFGLYDMHGNVWEWVEDCWHASYQGAPVDGSAWTSGSCNTRVLRGGSWTLEMRYLRSAYRNGNTPMYRGNSFGFRLAEDL
jgi:formylglycine-generating enzyme required for sulfatase activity